MSFPTKSEKEEKQRVTEYAAAKERGLDEIYHAYQVIPRNETNDGMIEEICCHYLEIEKGEVAPTLAVFRSAVEEDPGILGSGNGVFIESVEKQKTKVLADIKQLLTGIMSPFDLKSELSKLSFQSLEQVRARKQQIVERQRLSKMQVPAIKQELAAGRPKPHRYHPYDPLPPEITADQLKATLRTYEARKYLRRFGADQINDRLFGRG